MVKPPSRIDSSISSSPYSSIERSDSGSSTDQKVGSARQSVDFTPPAHSSKRLYVWSTIARHMPHNVAKLLSRIILNSTIVAQHQVGVTAHMLSSSYMPSVRTEQFSVMTPFQISKLDKKQIAAMNEHDYNVLSGIIGRMDSNEFSKLCSDIKNPQILFKLRMKSLEEPISQIPREVYFAPSGGHFKGDLTRSPLNIGEESYPLIQKTDYEAVRLTKEEAENVRYERAENALREMLGDEATNLLPTFANQGALAFVQIIIAQAFPPPCVARSGISQWQCTVSDGIVNIQIFLKGIVATEKETQMRLPEEPREEMSLSFAGNVLMTIPLEDLQRGDFSNAKAQAEVYS